MQISKRDTFTLNELEKFLESYKKHSPEVPLTAEGLVQLFRQYLEDGLGVIPGVPVKVTINE